MVVALFLVAQPVLAQPAFQASVGRVATATDGAPGAGDDRGTTTGAVLLEHWMSSERLRLYYDLNAGDYTTPGDWSYFLHQAGATWRADIGDAGTRLYVGGTGTWRDNGASWAAAGYSALGAFANLETRPREGLTMRAGYRLDVRRFPDYSELDQLESGVFGSLLANLPSRTTLIGEVRVGAKSYQGLSIVPLPDEVGAAAGATGGAHGSGRGASGVRLSGRTAAEWPAADPVDRAGLVSWMGRIAQSLADRTGASFQYYQRTTFGTLPPVMVETPALFFDDGVYDDPFASGQRTLSTTLTHAFARGDTLEGWGSWSGKDYTATPAYDLDGDVLAGAPLRQDRIWRAGAAWTHPFLPDRTGALAVDVVVSYSFTSHASNDLFYNYRSNVVGLAVSVGY